MTLENPHFQQEIHLQMVDFPASHVSFLGCIAIGLTGFFFKVANFEGF